jgi:putative peptidoglycan lipid II flippase
MWFAGVALIVNVVLSLALFPFLAHVGIALATAVASWVNAGLLWITLSRRGQFTVDAALRKRLPLIGVAAVLMGVCLAAAQWALQPFLVSPALVVRAVSVGLLVIGGVVVFAVFCQLTGAADFRGALAKLRRGA